MSDQNFKNLDPRALNVKPEGWSAEDRARNLLDIFNRESNPTKNWDYKEFVKVMFPFSGTHDFVEGYLLAALYMSEMVSGGFVRDQLRIRDGDTNTIDPLLMQRFLDWAEKQKSDTKEAK